MASALVSVRGVPHPMGENRRSERLDNGTIWTAPVGQRSNIAHLDSGIRVMLENVLGKRLKLRRDPKLPEWYLLISQHLAGSSILSSVVAQRIWTYLERPTKENAFALASLCTFKILGGMHVYWWEERYRAVALDERFNGNTPAVMLERWRRADADTLRHRMIDEVSHAYPWKEGRAFNDKGKGHTVYDSTTSEFVVTSPHPTMRLPAPAFPPSYVITITDAGVSVA